MVLVSISVYTQTLDDPFCHKNYSVKLYHLQVCDKIVVKWPTFVMDCGMSQDLLETTHHSW